jgi:hypothetical protein
MGQIFVPHYPSVRDESKLLCVSQWQTAGKKLRTALKAKGDLGARTFARMLAEEAGQTSRDAIETERRGVMRRLKSQWFQDETAERYARVLGLPANYFKVDRQRPPTHAQVARFEAQLADLQRQAREWREILDRAAES